MTLGKGSDSSDRWGEKSSVDRRIAANLGIKSPGYRSCFGALLYKFLRARKNGVGLGLFALSGLISFRCGRALAVASDLCSADNPSSGSLHSSVLAELMSSRGGTMLTTPSCLLLTARESGVWPCSQCSQRSRGPVGPGGRTAKNPGPDWTTKFIPSSSAKSKRRPSLPRTTGPAT